MLLNTLGRQGYGLSEVKGRLRCQVRRVGCSAALWFKSPRHPRTIELPNPLKAETIERVSRRGSGVGAW